MRSKRTGRWPAARRLAWLLLPAWLAVTGAAADDLYALPAAPDLQEEPCGLTAAEALRRYGPWVGLGALVLFGALGAYGVAVQRRLRALEQRLRVAGRELEAANVALAHRAAIDGLTEIANRRAFDEALAREWARATRARQPLALIIADIDHFKHHNDTYGHLAGDACLKQVAAQLRALARRPGDLVARYGGEEFAVILPGTDTQGAGLVAERMRVAVEALKLAHVNRPVGHDVTLSLGVAARVPGAGIDPQALIAAADEALYRAKAVGRNQVMLAAPG